MAKRGAKLKAWPGLQNCRVPVVVTCLVVILVLLILLFCNNGKSPDSSFGYPIKKWNSFESVQFNPTIELRNGTDVIWQIPSLPKAVLFVAHGCDGRAANFWDRSSSCPNCIGLPEERLLVLHALARKFAVITISSAGRCWTFGEERLIVKNIIQWWAQTHNLESLPLVALGASSGGYFVSALATNLRFSSITLMIAAGKFDQMDITVKSFVDGNGYMKKDGRATRWKEALRERKNLVLDKSMVQHVQEELNLAFAHHEMTSLQSEQIFKWFESHLN
ncbi:hypothetical protein D5086_005054 [Populus alba]|uniref:Uncharacterized protein n=1 Tax=Populus alba TaxID=43335 RepID=A0ACC4CS70_POPAL